MYEDVKASIGRLSTLPHEKLVVFYANGNDILGKFEKDGLSSQIETSPEDVVGQAKEVQATEVIMIHNHPGGTRCPSAPDIEYAKQLQSAMPGTMVKSYVVSGTNVGRDSKLIDPENFIYTEYDGDTDPALHTKEFVEMASRILTKSGVPFCKREIEQMFGKVETMHDFRDQMNGVLKPFGKVFDLKDQYKKLDSKETI